MKKITKTGKKALEARKMLNENQRLPADQMKKITGEETFAALNGTLWATTKGKDGKTMAKRQMVLRDVTSKKK